MAGREDRGDQRLSQEDLNCSCCFELMVEPTTLNCGHSFCRFCLAQWWSASKHATCPECRQPWAGFPKVNIVLRKTIKVLFPREAVERQRYQEFSPDYNSLLSEFESLNVTEGRNRSSTSSGRAQVVHRQQVGFSLSRIVLIILSILGVIMFAYQVLNLFMKPKDILVEKTVLQWTAEDVAKWVSSLGNWTQGYEKRFYNEKIDGNLLLSLSESDLEMSLDIDVSFHRRTLIKEIETLRNLGVKSPTDIWEYKDAHPARTNFILWGLREFPRLTVVYSFFFYHEEVFQPLLCYTSELVDIEEDFNEVRYSLL
ncbi:Bifunctional apoptosis regulator [Acropora cervicornis]|uniref:Bifunctional apoptosis regulator n=1 Tax=Acropora cervicornis TaxID=6130 RepID=A0AAD9VF74_ACRCE|nr:Bifunctional apoptosis regulator [Acropora cervicornis]